MNKTKNARLSGNARALRRDMTPAARHLWYDFLKPLPVMVHRQKVIGPYIVDFYIAQPKIVIELDGTQHADGVQRLKDQTRDEYLSSLGISVLRYDNVQIRKEFRFVCQEIWNQIFEE